MILGKQPLSPPAMTGDLETFMSWADELRHLKVLQYYFVSICLPIIIKFFLVISYAGGDRLWQMLTHQKMH